MAVLDACRLVDQAIRDQPAYAHTSHFRLEVDGQAVFDRHYRGPALADTFSVTKSVVATLAGIAVAEGRLGDLDLPAGRALPALAGTPAAGQTLRQLLTMTRGAETEGPFEIDEVMAQPRGWLERIAAAPQLDPPGTRFRYDNGGAHLFGAALSALVGMPLSAYAATRLFGPLAIGRWHWPRDPDGYDYGHGHLRLAAADLARLGRLWLDGGRWEGRQLLDPGFAAAMGTAHNGGGPPEDHPYGYLLWVAPDRVFAAGWAGQLVAAVPAARAVVVVTGDPRFDPGPPASDQLQPGWRPAGELVSEHLLPALGWAGACANRWADARMRPSSSLERQPMAKSSKGSGRRVSDLLRVPPGPVDLASLDTRATPGFNGGKKAGKAALADIGARLSDLQEKLHAEGVSGGTRRVLLVLQGMDTSGKGGVLRHVVGQVDPQGCEITSFKAPTAEELAHDFLWRIRRQVPGPGKLGVFDRSHYEDVLNVRVHDLVPRSTWTRRYGAINRFEARLVADDVRVVKVFLHISKEEQRQRLLARLDNPAKHWKFNPNDVDERAFWADYQEAYAAVLERCNSDAAPWYRVPADRKWYRDWAIASLLAEQLEDMKLTWPGGDFDVEEQRARLLADA